MPQGQEGAEALPARALELDLQAAVGQAVRVAADQLAGEHCADRAVDVAGRHAQLLRLAVGQSHLRLGDELLV